MQKAEGKTTSKKREWVSTLDSLALTSLLPAILKPSSAVGREKEADPEEHQNQGKLSPFRVTRAPSIERQLLPLPGTLFRFSGPPLPLILAENSDLSRSKGADPHAREMAERDGPRRGARGRSNAKKRCGGRRPKGDARSVLPPSLSLQLLPECMAIGACSWQAVACADKLQYLVVALSLSVHPPTSTPADAPKPTQTPPKERSHSHSHSPLETCSLCSQPSVPYPSHVRSLFLVRKRRRVRVPSVRRASSLCRPPPSP
ncbi:hypothetical protein GW17_00060031, partial [Ensete ventricosum]